MKNVRRYLAALLVVCMVFTCSSVSAFADEVPESASTTETVVDESVNTVADVDATEANTVADVDEAEANTVADVDEAEDNTDNSQIVVQEQNKSVESDEQPIQLESSSGMNTVDKTRSVSLDTSKFYKVFHLDCGRKYFSVSDIKAIIDTMATEGYNTLELAVGNDALRLILDDMSLTDLDSSYTDAAVTAAIEAGNTTYSTKNGCASTALTESDMDEIISYANGKNIAIMPLVNTPGHMNAILTAMTQLGISNAAYSTSSNTVDLTNGTAANFTMALVQKYITYFADKGCTMFNMGADEYANDISGNPNFSGLISASKYSYFGAYVNNIAAMIQNAGMTPVAFNDGIYYNQDTTCGTIDTNIVISYWSSGWSGYNVASASYLANKGFKILNTNGNWYYVLNAANGTSFSTAKSNLQNTAYNSVQGSGTMTVVGSMICYWCDSPGYDYTTTEAGYIKTMLETFADANADKDEPFYVDTTTEPVTISITSDSAGTISGGSSVTVTKKENVELNITDKYVVYDIVPYVNGAAYTGEATVSLPIPEGWDASKVYAFVVNSDNSITTIKNGTAKDGYYTYTAPHFSYNGLATAADDATTGDEATKAKTINLTYGGDAQTVTVENNNYAGTYTADPADIATVKVTGNDATEGSQVETAVTSVSTNSSYYIKNSSGQYLNASGSFVDDIANAVAWTWNGTNLTYNSKYLRYNNGWTTTSKSKDATTLYFNNGTFYRSRSWSFSGYTYSNSLGTPVTYTTTDPVAAKTTITFTPVNAGRTYVTIGDTKYTVIVAKATQTVTLLEGNYTTYTDTKASTAVSADTSVATVSANGSTLTITSVAEGETTITTDNCVYTVKVTKEDLTNVNQTIEFWITNRQVTANDATSMSINAGTSTVNSENGAAIADLVPAEGTYSTDTMVYWKSVRLASTNKQTTASGVDKTLAGTDFTRIRYFNGSWAYYDGSTWTNVASGDQLIAYYLQKTTVTDEVTTLVVDWGPVKANWGDLNYLGTKYVLLDYTVKYESGEESPSSYTNAKTLAFHCDVSTKKNNVLYRTIGMTKALETSDYEVYMITATPTSDSTSTVLASTAASNGTISYNGTEEVVWAATQADLDNSGLGTWTSISGAYTYSIGGEPIVPGMEIYSQHGMKITYYVRAKVTDDSLTVKYVNETTGDEFYNYNIAVKEGTTFNSGIALANPWKAALTNGSVTNTLGKTQTVSADLSTMPEIGVSYRYSDYTCTKVERSDDGKTVTLYYTFNNTHSFVADFGLPIKITTSDLGITGDWTSATVTNVTYGTATASVGEGITYTPNTVLQGIEQLSLNLSDGTNTTTHIIYIYPATTVYYEEGFASYSDNWTGNASKGSSTQTTEKLGSHSNVYGYDGAYSSVGASNGTQATSSNKGDTATITFNGTGIDIYANSTTSTGRLSILIKHAGSVVKFAQVNTEMVNGTGDATKNQAVDGYNIPVYSIDDLAYGSYEVTISHITDAGKTSVSTVNLDGFRVYNTLSVSTMFTSDKEDNPNFIELRNQVLAKYGISVDSATQTYTSGETATDATVAIISNTAQYSETTVDDLLTNGPKNEIYLQPGQAITFSVSTSRQVEIGLKALNAATSYTVNGGETTSISTSTDMFYNIGSNEQQVITNTGSGILAITKLKVCDEATLNPLTDEDIANAVQVMNGEAEVEPEVSYADATASISLVDYTGKVVASTSLTENGVEGEDATFAAADIQAAAESVLPSGYGFADASAIADQTVAYGEDGAVKIQVGKVATLKITYKKLFGKTLGTATLTHVQTSKTSKCTFTTKEIKAAAPSGAKVISLAGTSVNYGKSKSITATCR